MAEAAGLAGRAGVSRGCADRLLTDDGKHAGDENRGRRAADNAEGLLHGGALRW